MFLTDCTIPPVKNAEARGDPPVINAEASGDPPVINAEASGESNAEASGESKSDTITEQVVHGTTVNYYCDDDYSPKEAQPSECRNGVIDVLNIECNQGTF